jgi:hypothetical protein
MMCPMCKEEGREPQEAVHQIGKLKVCDSSRCKFMAWERVETEKTKDNDRS